MNDFSEIYERFEAIKRTLIHLENKMLSDGASISVTDHSIIIKLLRMAECEAQGILVLILRLRGSNGTVRRHGQDAAVSWSAGVDQSSGQISMTTTDVFSNLTETYMMAPEQFDRLIEYFVSVRDQLRLGADLAPRSD